MALLRRSTCQMLFERSNARANNSLVELQDVGRLKGKQTSAYPDDLKYAGSDHVIYRENLALIA
jgi:hypothetical protein